MISGEGYQDILAPKAMDLESTTYERLYQIAWHASTAMEILEADLRSLADIIEIHGQMLDAKFAASSKVESSESSSNTYTGSQMLEALERANPRFHNPVHQQLRFASQTMQNMSLRCKTYKERAHNDSRCPFRPYAVNICF
jgi:hypothetical protein